VTVNADCMWFVEFSRFMNSVVVQIHIYSYLLLHRAITDLTLALLWLVAFSSTRNTIGHFV